MLSKVEINHSRKGRAGDVPTPLGPIGPPGLWSKGVIPNLLKDYCDTLKWAFPLLLAIAFLCLFAVGHLQARVEQDWLDRLRQRNRSQRDGIDVNARTNKQPRADGACRRAPEARGGDAISPRRAAA